MHARRSGRRASLEAALAAVATAAILGLAGCSFNYEPATVAESFGEAIPDTILENFSQTVVRDGRPELVLQAGEAKTYSASNRVVLSRARFQEYDSTGKLSIEGEAARVVFHSDTENAEFSGGIDLYSAQDKARLKATALDWDREHRSVRGAPQDAVHVEKDDGSRIEGRGFEADFRTRTIRFGAGVSGTVVTAEDKEVGP
jgi:LPS export ABC transporter protein LptC